jgi:hypothetical protein
MSITRIRPWMLITFLCLLYCLTVIITKNDPLELVTIGTQFSEGIAEGTEGYDGQFVYYIARDPSTADQFLDVPAYRFQRILLPALGMVLSFGQPVLIPWVLLIINLIALAVGTALLEYLLVQHHVSRWYVLGYGLTLGTFGAVRLSLPEPLAYGLVIGAILLANRERWLWSAALLALAALTKETALIFVAGYGLYLLAQRRWRILVAFGAIAGLPFVAWQGILYARLGAFGVGSGGAMATSFEMVPFGGVIRIVTESPPEIRLQILLIFAIILVPFVIVPTLWGLRQCWRDFRQNKVTLYTYLLFASTAVMLFVPFSTYREPQGILRFIVGLQIAVILYAAERRNIRVLRNSTIWVVTLLFLVPSDFVGNGGELAETMSTRGSSN